MLFINLINTFALVLLINLLHINWNYIGVFAITYGLLRFVSFGVHADSIVVCTLLSMTYFIGGTLLASRINIPIFIEILICLLCVFIFFKFAPAETKKRPLDDNIFLFRILSLAFITLAIAVFVVLKLKGFTIYSNLVLIAMLCQSINLLPIMYTLFTERTTK